MHSTSHLQRDNTTQQLQNKDKIIDCITRYTTL